MRRTHAQVVHTLLSAKANPLAKDRKGRTPVDYATISPGIWPFFQGATITLSLLCHWQHQCRRPVVSLLRGGVSNNASGTSRIVRDTVLLEMCVDVWVCGCAGVRVAVWVCDHATAKGCSKTPKSELVDKGIIKRAVPPPSPVRTSQHGQVISGSAPKRGFFPSNAIADMSRPGSAYVRVQFDPLRPGTAVSRDTGRPEGGYNPIGRGYSNHGRAGAGVGAGAGAGAGAGGGMAGGGVGGGMAGGFGLPPRAGAVDVMSNAAAGTGLRRKPSLHGLRL